MNKSHFKHPIIGILLQTEVNLEIKLDIISQLLHVYYTVYT